MPSIKERYAQNSPYFKADDVKAGDITLTIAAIYLDEYVGTKQCDIVSFSNYDSQLILSPTTARQIAAICGDNTDGWIGKSITLYFEPNVYYQGTKTGGIRVRSTTPQGNGAVVVAKPEIDDSVPF
jgi:hypothetical protein